MELPELRTFLKNHLTGHIAPFWQRQAVDWKNGGLFTCITDEGQIRSRDKYMWSQTRGLWTFSALSRRIGTDETWLDIAHDLFSFLRAHGRDSEGSWVFLTDETGRVLRGAESIYTDGFAILGLVEYYYATGDIRALDLARETYQITSAKLDNPGSYSTAPYPTPEGMRAHGELMVFSLAYCELGRAAVDDNIMSHGRRLGRLVLDHFLRTDDQVLLEYLGMDLQPRDTPEGRAMVPGHGMESLYFQIMNFADSDRPQLIERACEGIRWCLERGWDAEFGGLFLGLDIRNRRPVYWKDAELKLWWPHTEALAACLIAYEYCRKSWCLEWYAKIHSWAFSRFPVRGFGEWTQRLDREGREKVDRVVALPVKDPFHLPRSLIFCIESLDRLERERRNVEIGIGCSLAPALG